MNQTALGLRGKKLHINFKSDVKVRIKEPTKHLIYGIKPGLSFFAQKVGKVPKVYEDNTAVKNFQFTT